MGLVTFAWLAAGLALLIVGAELVVRGASRLAAAIGIPPLIVGLRGERDIAAGNVIGSSILNLLSVLGLSSLLAPGGVGVPQSALAFDIPVMIAAAVAALPIFFTGSVIARGEGWLFLGYYAAYTAYLISGSSQHDALPTFSTVMLTFVLPVTVRTLMMLVVREVRARQGLKLDISRQ